MSDRGKAVVHRRAHERRQTMSGPGAPIKLALEARHAKPDGMSWPDYLVLLLQIGAELEHALMVQYLYAAYSLGGEAVEAPYRAKVQQWQESILTVAREEMGHLLTVQNILTLFGAPLNFARDDYPWDSPFYPAPFCLEPVSLSSLACYIFAEAPNKVPNSSAAYRQYNRTDKREIVKLVRKRMAPGKAAHHVDEIYEDIIAIIADPQKIPDECFRAESYTRQMTWDEFAKGYGPRAPETVSESEKASEHAKMKPYKWPARVILPRMATRVEVLSALKDIAGQGESPHLGNTHVEPSHFDRFLEVYQGLKALRGKSPRRRVVVTRKVVSNPTTRDSHPPDATLLTNRHTRQWAQLANLRYRILLMSLAHMYRIVPDPAAPAARPGMLARIFGEMFNLKALAALLVRMPAHDDPRKGMASVPFELPYSLDLPDLARERWSLHEELYLEAMDLTERLLKDEESTEGRAYLAALRDLDQQALAWLAPLLNPPAAGKTFV